MKALSNRIKNFVPSNGIYTATHKFQWTNQQITTDSSFSDDGI
jgi:hypothetical protein